MSKGKTSIIATLRLWTAQIADRILVMESGQIVVGGNHHQLLYAKMFRAQGQWYRN